MHVIGFVLGHSTAIMFLKGKNIHILRFAVAIVVGRHTADAVENRDETRQ